MNWSFQPDRPIYVQLIERIKLLILSGAYPAGSRLPSVRDMASEASVNPNTLQKALSELEREGLVYTQRTSGRFVTEDENMIKQVKKELAIEQIELVTKKLIEMGFSKEEMLALIESRIKEMK
ncbi:MAG: GntR family transcriptional regulator [Clostridiales bacterium]|nr:GntR family transcriptional regulator [Clostridiales bacterium]